LPPHCGRGDAGRQCAIDGPQFTRQGEFADEFVVGEMIQRYLA